MRNRERQRNERRVGLPTRPQPRTVLPLALAPRLISREAAAEYISVSPNTFDALVKDQKMPAAKLLGGRRIAWDVRALDDAIDALPVRLEDIADADDTWSDIDAP